MTAAAFFDLDRTPLRGSSTHAPSFRSAGTICVRHVVRAKRGWRVLEVRELADPRAA